MYYLLVLIPVLLTVSEAVLRFLAFLLLPFLGARLRSVPEFHNSVLYKCFPAFNMVGMVILETKLGQERRWEKAAEALSQNVAILGLDCSGWGRLPFIVLPGKPTRMKVEVRTTGAKNLAELEEIAHAEMQRLLDTRWVDSDSPFSILVIGGKSEVAVMFAADHRLLDGSSVIELARRYMLLLAEQDPGPPIPAKITSSVDESYAWIPLFAIPSAIRFLLGILQLYKDTRGFTLKAMPLLRQEGNDECLDVTKPPPWGQNLTLLSFGVLSAAETAALAVRCRAAGVSVGNAVTAATTSAVMQIATTTEGRDVYMTQMVDHRRLQPPSNRFPLGIMSTVTLASCRLGPLSGLALMGQAAIIRKISHLTSWFDALRASYAWQYMFTPFYASIVKHARQEILEGRFNNWWPHFTCSNLGQLALPKNPAARRGLSSTSLIPEVDYSHFPRVLRFLGSASSVSSFSNFSLFSLTTEGQLCLSISACRFAWSQKRLDLLRDEIIRLLGTE